MSMRLCCCATATLNLAHTLCLLPQLPRLPRPPSPPPLQYFPQTAPSFTHTPFPCPSPPLPCPLPAHPPQACNRQNMYCVPLYDSLGEHAIEYIIKHSESTIVFAQAAKLATLAKSLPHVRACMRACVRTGGRPGARAGGHVQQAARDPSSAVWKLAGLQCWGVEGSSSRLQGCSASELNSEGGELRLLPSQLAATPLTPPACLRGCLPALSAFLPRLPACPPRCLRACVCPPCCLPARLSACLQVTDLIKTVVYWGKADAAAVEVRPHPLLHPCCTAGCCHPCRCGLHVCC